MKVENANTADATLQTPEVQTNRKKKKLSRKANLMMTIFLSICVIASSVSLYKYYELYKTFEPILIGMLVFALALFFWYLDNLMKKETENPKDALGNELEIGDIVAYNFYPIYTPAERRKGVVTNFEMVGKVTKQPLVTILPAQGKLFKEFPEKLEKVK